MFQGGSVYHSCGLTKVNLLGPASPDHATVSAAWPCAEILFSSGGPFTC